MLQDLLKRVTADDDEFDPFAEQPDDPPPGPRDEGDDRVHAGDRDA